jgi:hypothetical protein
MPAKAGISRLFEAIVFSSQTKDKEIYETKQDEFK